jgi:hypothetical protein
MKPFRALLVKDWQINRKYLLIPAWFVLGAYAVIIIGSIIAMLRGDFHIDLNNIPKEFLNNPAIHQMLSLMIQGVMMVMVFGNIVVITALSVASGSLNSDIRHKCELFHRSQPISFIYASLSRYLVLILGSLGIAFGVGLLNMLVVNITLSIIGVINIDWWLSFNGFLLGWVHTSMVTMVLGSFCFLLSGIFRENAFGKGLLGLGAIELITRVLNYLFNWTLPSIFKAIYDVSMSGFYGFQTKVQAMQNGSGLRISVGKDGMPDVSIPPDFLSNLWSSFFSMHTLLQLAVCAGLFIVATLLYQRREVQF